MDHRERERDRGRGSRASSTSSLGREVRCACQFFQSDSLLPERRAMHVTARPSSRNTGQTAATNPRGTSEDAAMSDTNREHEYEPIGTPLVNLRTMKTITTAPVVRIIDTDVAPVADSDESIDLRGRFAPGPVLEGNELILPLDGQIEDSAMETRELAGGGDTSEELESPRQLQDRLEERFLNAATPCNESRTDGEVNTSQVDSSAMEELPLRRSARGLPQRLRSQAGKIRSRIKSMQRPNFSLPIDRLRSEKTKKTLEKSRGASSDKTKGKSDRSRSSTSETKTRSSTVVDKTGSKTTEKRTRMDRLRSSLPDRPKITFPDRPKFNFPDRTKFHLPERPRFNIKKPNIRFPKLGKSRGGASPVEASRQRSDESCTGSRRNIFDFTTYPRFFDRKTKNRDDYATSSPKESRAQSAESSTLPGARRTTADLGARWSQKFTDIKFADDDEDDDNATRTLAERSRPWRRPSIEEPRLSLRPQESIDEPESLPWEDSEERGRNQQIDELPSEDDNENDEDGDEASEDDDDEEEEEEEDEEPEEKIKRSKGLKLKRRASGDTYEEESSRIDPRLYGESDLRRPDERDAATEEIADAKEFPENRDAYRAGFFMPVDPRFYAEGKIHDETEIVEMKRRENDEHDERLSSGMDEDLSSARSDREQQQSSGSSCDRRRRGVIDDIDSYEFFLRETIMRRKDETTKTIVRYPSGNCRDPLGQSESSLAREIVIVAKKPPNRPSRTRSMRKRNERSIASCDAAAPPIRPKRDNQRRSIEANYVREDFSYNPDDPKIASRRIVVYHAESAPDDLARIEPLDDIVIVKPLRRKSSKSSSLRSQTSLLRSESPATMTTTTMPPRRTEVETLAPSAPPRRKKRLRAGEDSMIDERHVGNFHDEFNGHNSSISYEPDNETRMKAPKKPGRMSARRDTTGSHEITLERLDRECIESNVPPVPPKRSSHSRGASIVPDDDDDEEDDDQDEVTSSRGAESIPENNYTADDTVGRYEDESFGLNYSDYAIIEKRVKPPRPPPPPPPRKRRADDNFGATLSSRSVKVPQRPQRAYSTLRQAVTTLTPTGSIQRNDSSVTAYEELDSENEITDERDEAVSKIQDRPLPAPPRPPRSRRDRSNEERDEDVASLRETREAFASTQTDPLPDDMIIEEEVTRAKLVVSSSRSGSQILVTSERIPSPAAGVSTINGFPSLFQDSPIFQAMPDSSSCPRAVRTAEFTSESPERTISRTFERSQRATSPVRRSTVPAVPPLPSPKILRNDDDDGNYEIHERIRSESPSSSSSSSAKRQLEPRSDYPESERIRLEEELEEARSFRTAILGNGESLKITSLEVADLRVDRLNVADLQAERINSSGIDALVVRATEISRNGPASSEENVNFHPSLLRELVAIRSQLELVNSSTEAPRKLSTIDNYARDRSYGDVDEKSREIARSRIRQSARLHLDEISRDTETRAIFSSTGAPRDAHPSVFYETPRKSETPTRNENSVTRSSTRSRSSSPGRTGSPTRLRQTASPVKSLPPVISVTPDAPDVIHGRVESSEITIPQRAVLSYIGDDDSFGATPGDNFQTSRRPSSPPLSSTVALVTENNTSFIAFPTSRIPAEFFSLASPSTTTTATTTTTARIDEQEPGIVDLGQQLFRALRLAGKRAMRHLVGYIVNRIGHEETDTKIREIELALCALLLIIVGLLIVCFGGPRTITHHHHWDYFNPPRL